VDKIAAATAAAPKALALDTELRLIKALLLYADKIAHRVRVWWIQLT